MANEVEFSPTTDDDEDDEDDEYDEEDADDHLTDSAFSKGLCAQRCGDGTQPAMAMMMLKIGFKW